MHDILISVKQKHVEITAMITIDRPLSKFKNPKEDVLPHCLNMVVIANVNGRPKENKCNKHSNFGENWCVCAFRTHLKSLVCVLLVADYMLVNVTQIILHKSNAPRKK